MRVLVLVVVLVVVLLLALVLVLLEFLAEVLREQAGLPLALQVDVGVGLSGPVGQT